jgi:hypothetical protein
VRKEFEFKPSRVPRYSRFTFPPNSSKNAFIDTRIKESGISICRTGCKIPWDCSIYACETPEPHCILLRPWRQVLLCGLVELWWQKIGKRMHSNNQIPCLNKYYWQWTWKLGCHQNTKTFLGGRETSTADKFLHISASCWETWWRWSGGTESDEGEKYAQVGIHVKTCPFV